ncbi:S9 family peptidase [Naasia sp. SYSU D00948]|uniref:S9 family peptidase n=1 Tax=Naasia sp. SYSU D00948 TaxID=2817379 RepID=UPI001B3022EB|nr:S9 family peptidase [Naasia sp. SYSU D00948]
MTDRVLPDVRTSVEEAVELGEQLVDAWGCWSPTMTRNADRVAYISDRSGMPELWVQDLEPAPAPATRVPLTEDPVVAVEWSADGAWLSCAVATDGGVRTQVWVVRPDGTDARRVAGNRHVHAELGPWTRSGHRVVVMVPSPHPGEGTSCYLADPATGELTQLAVGELIHVLDISMEERLLVLRDGRRGHEFCVVVDRLTDRDHRLLPPDETGSTEVAFVRRAPEDDPHPAVAYLVTDAGRPRRQLVAAPLAPGGRHDAPRTLAARDDAELEDIDADDAGTVLMLVWNVAGRSELELMDALTEERIHVPDLPGTVASDPVLSRDGSSVVVTVDGPERPRALWRLDVATLTWTPVTETPPLPDRPLVAPTLETYRSSDGLELTGWLYRVPGRTEPGPATLWFHGGPESQERPDFTPEHQALVAAGIAVFAPNIRGSSGFGREFVHADDIAGRYGAFADVLASAAHLEAIGVADPERIAVTGRSYGGYLTLAALAFHPGLFAAGVDICGMSDLRTFYRDTEPWIASAAFPKYGHPQRDRKLLKAISPLRAAANIEVPLLVVHGEHDTNVPIGEAHQIVAALQHLGRPVEYLELPGEGHVYRRATSRKRLVTEFVRFLSRTLRA